MLTEDLKVLLASVNSLSIKAQNFHWNVEGDNFPQYHEFFGNFYEEVYSAVDKIAEYIRTLDSIVNAINNIIFFMLCSGFFQNASKLPLMFFMCI